MKINANLIRHNNEVYPIKNISTARVVQRKYRGPETKEQERRTKLAMFCLFVISIAASVALFFDGNLYCLLTALLGVICLVGMSKSADPADTEYAVEITMNSGNTSLFWATDRTFVHRVADIVFDAISAQSDKSYTINVDNSTIVENSVDQSTTNVSVTNDYSIRIKHYEGMSEDQMAFFSNQVSEALKEVGQAVDETKDDELRTQLSEVVSQLNESKPNKGKVANAWGKFKDLCEGYESLQTALGAASLAMTAGIAMLAG